MRRLLLDATLELLAERGSERLTTTAIVERAHVSTGTFYRYFEDRAGVLAVLRDEAVLAINADLIAGVARAVDQDLTEAVREIVSTLVAAFERHGPVVRVMVDAVPAGTNANVLPEIESGLLQLASVIPRRHLRDVTPQRFEAVVFMTMGVVVSTCLRIALDRPSSSDREELIGIATGMLLGGLND